MYYILSEAIPIKYFNFFLLTLLILQRILCLMLTPHFLQLKLIFYEISQEGLQYPLSFFTLIAIHLPLLQLKICFLNIKSLTLFLRDFFDIFPFFFSDNENLIFFPL